MLVGQFENLYFLTFSISMVRVNRLYTMSPSSICFSAKSHIICASFRLFYQCSIVDGLKLPIYLNIGWQIKNVL